MKDLLTAMREFRALEERRAARGLSRGEHSHWDELRRELGPRARLVGPLPTLEVPAPPEVRVPLVLSAEAGRQSLADDPDLPELAPEQPSRAEAASPGPAAPPAPDSTAVQGEERVILHLLSGAKLHGLLRDADLAAAALDLVPPGGGPARAVPIVSLKAVFFLLGPGAPRAELHGQRVTVEFDDGRRLVGRCPRSPYLGVGFFLVPEDPGSPVARIYVYRAAVQTTSSA